MKILAHRGFWLSAEEQNTVIAFERALKNGFGIETDIRDYRDEIVISHDFPNANSLSFDNFVNLVTRLNPTVLLALNIKSDGLHSKLVNNELSSMNYFYFDMSNPETLRYQKNNLPFYTRFSDVEPTPVLYEKSQGVWMDNFSSDHLDFDLLLKFLSDSKKVALVSPELHGFKHLDYWSALKEFFKENQHFTENCSICTDFPSQAKEYFDV